MAGDEISELPNLEPMTPPARKVGRRRWFVPVAIGVVVHLGAFAVLHVPIRRQARPEFVRPAMEWVAPAATASDSVLTEQLLLFDHAPLFLPTSWSFAGSPHTTTITPPPTDLFEAYPDRLVFSDTPLSADATELPESSTPSELLSSYDWPYFDAFGRVDQPAEALPARAAFIEVRSARTGELLYTKAVPSDRVDPADDWPDWRPFDLYLSISRELTMATPLPGQGSGPYSIVSGAPPESVTEFFRNYLRREAKLELHLPPGFYRVTVGP